MGILESLGGLAVIAIFYFWGKHHGNQDGKLEARALHAGRPAPLAEAEAEVWYTCLWVSRRNIFVLMETDVGELVLFQNEGPNGNEIYPTVGTGYLKRHVDDDEYVWKMRSLAA